VDLATGEALAFRVSGRKPGRDTGGWLFIQPPVQCDQEHATVLRVEFDREEEP
jgi:hypothetical protein